MVALLIYCIENATMLRWRKVLVTVSLGAEGASFVDWPGRVGMREWLMVGGHTGGLPDIRPRG
jgi:hypothetical protein